jgi:hypothetical protein
LFVVLLGLFVGLLVGHFSRREKRKEGHTPQPHSKKKDDDMDRGEKPFDLVNLPIDVLIYLLSFLDIDTIAKFVSAPKTFSPSLSLPNNKEAKFGHPLSLFSQLLLFSLSLRSPAFPSRSPTMLVKIFYGDAWPLVTLELKSPSNSRRKWLMRNGNTSTRN